MQLTTRYNTTGHVAESSVLQSTDVPDRSEGSSQGSPDKKQNKTESERTVASFLTGVTAHLLIFRAAW